jgi:hypothetical protein
LLGGVGAFIIRPVGNLPASAGSSGICLHPPHFRHFVYNAMLPFLPGLRCGRPLSGRDLLCR